MTAKIHIPRSQILERGMQNKQSIDDWLRENIGIGNYKEWISFMSLPYRSFSFTNDEDATMFTLRWL